MPLFIPGIFFGGRVISPPLKKPYNFPPNGRAQVRHSHRPRDIKQGTKVFRGKLYKWQYFFLKLHISNLVILDRDTFLAFCSHFGYIFSLMFYPCDAMLARCTISYGPMSV